MGIIKRTLYTTALTGTALVGYIAGTTSVICPIPRDDPIWSSKVFSKYNIHKNPTTQDVVIKRIPLDKIRPELLQKDGDLALEFCRGIWAGWGKLFLVVLLISCLLVYTNIAWLELNALYCSTCTDHEIAQPTAFNAAT